MRARRAMPGRGHNESLRRHLSPLNAETISPLNLPAVRMGLLTKLNLLTVGLIFLTAIATTGLYLWKEWRVNEAELRTQGSTLAAILAEASEHGLTTSDRAYLLGFSTASRSRATSRMSRVLDTQQRTFAERTFADALQNVAVPDLPRDIVMPGPAKVDAAPQMIDGRRYIELLTPVLASSAPIPTGTPAEAGDDRFPTARVATNQPIGYVRIGMTFERQYAEFKRTIIGAMSIVALLVDAGDRRDAAAHAPPRRADAPADARGAGGRLGQARCLRPGELGRRARPADAYLQPHDAAAVGVAGGSCDLPAHARGQGNAAHEGARDRDGARVQARAARHPHRASESLAAEPAAEADPRAGTTRWQRTSHASFSTSTTSSGSTTRSATIPATSCCRRWRSGSTSAVRESDTVARLGGDEFVLILPGLDPAHATFETMTVLARVRESFLAPFRLSDQMPTLTCSVGVSMYPLDASDPVSLIKQADTAMYAAKEAGRNAYRFYTADMNARVQLRLQLETDMRRGLMDDEFFLVFQPQIEMQSGRAVGVEALLRWRDPERGVIAPSEFIPIAEESGMIQALGARVLRDACRTITGWHRQGMMLRLSVNLSVQQLQHDSWLGIVDEALAASGLPAHYLDLEITESVIITHPEKAVATLVKLKQRGVSITIDDFGTGYSSLSYLARLPIQAVKVDQRFVARPRAEPQRRDRSRRRSSRCRIRSAFVSSPKAWRPRPSSNS